MSTNDMWQPEQPPSQAVAIRGFLVPPGAGVAGLSRPASPDP